MKKILLIVLLSFNLLPGIKKGAFKWYAQELKAQMGEELPDVKVCAHYEETDLGTSNGWHVVVKCYQQRDCDTHEVLSQDCDPSSTYVGNDPDDPTGNPGGGGGGGSGGPTGGGPTSPPHTDPKRIPVSVHKFMDCFGNIPDNGAQYTIKIYVDLPVPSDPTAMLGAGGDPGHTFISMEKSNGGQSVTQTFGFYPEDGLTNLAFFPVASTIVNNGNGGFVHEYNASFTMENLTASQFAMLQTSAENWSSQGYDLNDYNCTNYALNVLNSIRPDSDPILSNLEQINNPWDGGLSTITFTASPVGLYGALQVLKMSNGPEANKVNISTTPQKAPVSHGECN